MVIQHAHRGRHGEQYHHNHPSLLTDQLYLSAARAISSRVLLDLGITCIINATLELPTLAYQEQDCLQVAVEDHVASKLYVYFDLVADKIKAVHDSDAGKAMIYCRAGMSRSASLCIAYFIKYHDMTLEDAFQYVKQRRPIIQPNIGFMRQLREFEEKVRRAKACDEANNNGGCGLPRTPSWKRRQRDVKLPALTFAECCSSDGEETLYDDYYSIKIIKPRPVAKRPRVSLCEDSLDLPAQAHDAAVLVEACAELLPKVAEAEMTTAVENVQPPQQQPQQQQPDFFSTIVIAEVHCPTQLEATSDCASSSSSEEGERIPKTAFSKISEPARIAVSCLHSALETEEDISDDDDDDEGPRQHQHSHLSFSVFPELRQLPQVSATLPLECPPQAVRTPAASSSKAVAVLAALLPTALFQEAAVLETQGLFKRQKLDPFLQQLQQASTAPETKAIPTCPRPLPSAPKEKRRLLERTKSIRLPGLRISPLPEKSKVDDLTKEEANYLEVCVCQEAPLAYLDEAGEDDIPPLTTQQASKATDVFGGVLRCCEVHEMEPALLEEIADADHKPNLALDFVARRTAIVCTASTLVFLPATPLGPEAKALPAEMLLPTRKYPYYSIVRGTQEAEPLVKATEGAVVESCWFFALPPKRATKTVCLVPRRASSSTASSSGKGQLQQQSLSARKMVRKHGKNWRDPPISWAAERYYIDLASEHMTAKPLAELNLCSATEVNDADKVKQVAVVRDASRFVTFGVSRITRFEPQAYSSLSVSNMCCHPLLSLAQTRPETSLLMENFFCQPTVAKSVAARSFHPGDQLLAVGIERGIEFDDRSALLEVIPESLGTDLGELKRRLLLLNDPVKIAIWLDIFKRKVIRARPIYARVVFQDFMAVAEVGDSRGYDSAEGVLEREWNEEVHRTRPMLEAASHAVQLFDPGTTEELDDHFDDCRSYKEISMHFKHHSGPDLVVASAYKDVGMEYYYIMGSARQHHFPTRISPRMCEPLMQVASVDSGVLFGLESKRSYVPLEWMLRRPFQRVAALMNHPAATSLQTTLLPAPQLPHFQLPIAAGNQDFSLGIASSGADEKLDAVFAADVLFYFEAKPEEMRCLTPLPTSSASTTAGSYQLFMPDPSLVDRLGRDTSHLASALEEDLVLSPASLSLADHLPASSPSGLRTSTSNSSRAPVAKRVSFREQTPPTPPAETGATRMGSLIRKMVPTSFVSYQTAGVGGGSGRARSTSRKRASVEEARSDRQAMATLKTSVRQASDLLERRRMRELDEGASDLGRRGREMERTAEARRRKLSPTHQALAEAGGLAIRGLLGAASGLAPQPPPEQGSRSALRKAARERSSARRSGRI